ncbi:AraC-like DNA-binding protein [Angulomicrobium tetraedrale]|uniref:AraC-like DNA-binding protein n=1 Tax=Ancylobacter tetraedralis TaxID=217068 RepID=A0A839Z4Q0_9HYPH|nr:AraC family transcriptional regulator [Ancylobacter tetraedralis]MBB3769911.1 AraC-like DNA-binding protein [Ancylobacter tetraedralis]
MSEYRKLDIDFRDVLTGLRLGERLRGAEALGASDDIFRVKEHNYRRVDDYTLLHVLNFEAGQPYSLKIARQDLVCIQAIVSGNYHRWIGQRMDLVSPHLLEISNVPQSVVDVGAGGRLRGLLIICDRRHLVEHYRLNVDRLPAAYRPIFLSRTGTPEVLHMPLSSTGLHLVDQILTCKYQEPLRGIFVGAKTIEILCDVVAQLGAMPGQGAPRPAGPRQKARAIEAAAEIYRREFGSPPTIEQLAQRVGLNRNELTSGFRDAFGVTPHAYALVQRMERAQQMLREGRLSISEVARRIGYEGYSSFARAYHAHYGRAPSLDIPALDVASPALDVASPGIPPLGVRAFDTPALGSRDE